MPSVFGSNQTPESESVLDQLVGDGKKFKDVESLAKGKAASDAHIVNLETQNRELMEELQKRTKAEEQVNRLLAESQAKETSGEGRTSPSINKEELAELVRNTVQNTNNEAKAEANLQKANDHLVKLYGEKASEVFKNKARELGLQSDFLEDVARKSPEAFMNILGISASGTSAPTVTKGSVNTESLSHQNEGSAPSTGTWAHYEKLRRDKPSEYWTPKVQALLFKDRSEKGSTFYK